MKLATNIAYDNRYKNVPSKGIGFGLQDFYVFPLYTEMVRNIMITLEEIMYLPI